MKHDPFHAPSFCKSRMGFLRELHGLYQEWGTDNSPSSSLVFRTGPSANETTTASMEQNFYSTMLLHEQESREKLKVDSASKMTAAAPSAVCGQILTTATPASIAGPVIGQNVFSA